MLNPLLELKKLTEKRLDYLSDINTAGIAFDKIGTFLYDDSFKKADRLEEALKKEESDLKKLNK